MTSSKSRDIDIINGLQSFLEGMNVVHCNMKWVTAMTSRFSELVSENAKLRHYADAMAEAADSDDTTPVVVLEAVSDYQECCCQTSTSDKGAIRK